MFFVIYKARYHCVVFSVNGSILHAPLVISSSFYSELRLHFKPDAMILQASRFKDGFNGLNVVQSYMICSRDKFCIKMVLLVFLLGIVHLVYCQFPPTPEGIKTLKSKFHNDITISYKQPKICETTSGVKSYAGYVHLPPHALNETHENQDYPINTFFWFFEARKNPANAPLAIWLNGGPGGSSMYGALVENGPCFVGNDSNSTYLNPWSWNNEVNLLYLDQPNQVGYSYDTLTNITTSLGTGPFFGLNVEPADFDGEVPEQNLTFLVGTTGTQNITHTANSTSHAAVALWHFAQTWLVVTPDHHVPATY